MMEGLAGVFARLEVVVLISAELESWAPQAGASAPPVFDDREFLRSDGLREVRRITLQDGDPAGGDPLWYAGPAPFRTQRSVLNTTDYRSFDDNASPEERSRYASAFFRQRLYSPRHRQHRAGTSEDQLDAWLPAKTSVRTRPRVLALELLQVDTNARDARGLLLLHATIEPEDADPLGGLRLLTVRSKTGRRWVQHMLRGAGRLPDDCTIYHLCFARPSEGLATLDAPTDDDAWSGVETFLWQLATLQGADYPVGPRNRKQIAAARRDLSGDWTCAVMRRGTAFLARSLDDEWADEAADGRRDLQYVVEMAPLLVRSLYADALALSVWKGMRMREFSAQLAALGDPVSNPAALVDIDGRFTVFRNTLWWEDTGLSGHATLLLRAHAATEGQQAGFDRLVDDLSDYSQKIERAAVQRSNEISLTTNALIGLVTVFAVPLAALQVFGTDSTWIWVAITGFLVLLGFLPAGDQIIGRNLPGELGTRDDWGIRIRVLWTIAWIVITATLLLVGVIPDDSPKP